MATLSGQVVLAQEEARPTQQKMLELARVVSLSSLLFPPFGSRIHRLVAKLLL